MLCDALSLAMHVHPILPAGDTDRQMVVVGRGVLSEEAKRVIPIVDEAIGSIVGLEQRRCVRGVGMVDGRPQCTLCYLLPRQELVGACQQEEAAIAGLQCRLDAEEQHRLVVLPAAVQREHEASLRGMAELKWLVAFNQRQCSRLHKRLEDVGEAM